MNQAFHRADLKEWTGFSSVPQVSKDTFRALAFTRLFSSTINASIMNFPLEGAVTEMSAENKQMLAASLEHMQVRDSLKMYNNLVERCFRECAEDMRSKALSSTEEKVSAADIFIL
jgi:hypothetical protein